MFVCRERVVDAVEDLVAVAEALTTPSPLPVQGIAQVRVILSDGAGPLYNPRSPESLRESLRRTLQLLDPLATW